MPVRRNGRQRAQATPGGAGSGRGPARRGAGLPVLAVRRTPSRYCGMDRRSAALGLALALAASGSAARGAVAQEWDSPAVRMLVQRAVDRRQQALADTTLTDFTARAHGFLFFLGQIGEGLQEPPRLIKSDQLELEVSWKAPRFSRQRIIGWRDRRELPTDISYHRDHLGIVLNNFADFIRLGEGDEVRDVPHPLSPAGLRLYQFALADSLTITLPDRAIRVYEVRVRPVDFRAPRLVGSLFLDVDRAELVRMRFDFTRAAYLDHQLEDITVSIENSLWGGRFWLPLRQEIEIRRRAEWLDFPARGIIRGRWEIDTYRFNQGLQLALFADGRPEIVAAPPEVRDSFPWTDSLEAEVRDVARPARLADLDAVRAEAASVAEGHVLTGLQRAQLGGASVSEFVHVDRAEGLALGVGGVLRSGDEATEFRGRAGAATATTLFTGGLALRIRRGAWTWGLAGYRDVRDMGDAPVIARAVNSLLAQETGSDFGDYYLATGGEGGVTRALGGRTALALTAGVARIDSLPVRATWARGAYRRPAPQVAEGSWAYARLGLRRQASSFAMVREFTGRAELEAAGLGAARYVRGYAEGRWQVPAGAGWLVLRASAGAATRDLPAHRAFVLGGRGTLVGEGFRALSGRQAAWLSADLRIPAGVPEIPLGSLAGTGRSATLVPFIAAGWTGGGVAGAPGAPARGVRPVVGLGLEWPHDLLRIDVGVSPRTGTVGVAVDVSRAFWDIL